MGDGHGRNRAAYRVERKCHRGGKPVRRGDFDGRAAAVGRSDNAVHAAHPVAVVDHRTRGPDATHDVAAAVRLPQAVA